MRLKINSGDTTRRASPQQSPCTPSPLPLWSRVATTLAGAAATALFGPLIPRAAPVRSTLRTRQRLLHPRHARGVHLHAVVRVAWRQRRHRETLAGPLPHDAAHRCGGGGTTGTAQGVVWKREQRHRGGRVEGAHATSHTQERGGGRRKRKATRHTLAILLLLLIGQCPLRPRFCLRCCKQSNERPAAQPKRSTPFHGQMAGVDSHRASTPHRRTSHPHAHPAAGYGTRRRLRPLHASSLTLHARLATAHCAFPTRAPDE